MIGLALLTVLAAQEPTFDDVISERMAAVDAGRLERTVRDLVAFGTRHVLSVADDPSRGTGAARAYLERALGEAVAASGGRLVVERKRYRVPVRRRGMPDEVEVENIVATLRGIDDPDRIYVVGGHYDSINARGGDGEGVAPGANDDASGTAVAVEACRVLAGVPLAATVVFVCYDGEEQGLLGSTAHAAELHEAGALVDGMITNDIVGNTLGMDGVRRRDYLRCFSYAPRDNDSIGRSLARAATRAGRRQDGFEVRLVYRGDRYGRGGDHRPFYQQGYPAIRFTEPREDFSRQHQDVTQRDGKPYGDLPDYMDFDYLARVARANVALLAELAAAPRCPDGVRARGARDAYDTDVTWRPVAGAAHYELVWRPTTAPDWTGSRRIDGSPAGRDGGSLRATLEGVCLDEVVVGVAAVAANGARSRVATPPEPDSFATRGAQERR